MYLKTLYVFSTPYPPPCPLGGGEGVSLNNLCKVFGLEGKIHPYKKEYNHISVLDNKQLLDELIKYCEVDCMALFNVLNRAQQEYIYPLRDRG